MKISIYAGEPIQRVLDGFDNRSGRLNTVAERYLDIIRRDCPALTEAEWCALCDALNGYMASDGSAVRMAWAEIADAGLIDGIGEKWEVDAQALAQRMRLMTAAEQTAIVEVTEAFWRHSDLPRRQALKLAGARIS